MKRKQKATVSHCETQFNELIQVDWCLTHQCFANYCDILYI